VRALEQLAKAEGSLCLRDSAKAVGIPEGRFIKLLHQHGWIYRRTGCSHWLGYAYQVQRGRLTHKVFTAPLPKDAAPGDNPRIHEQVRLTPKGLVDVARLLKGETEPLASSPTAAALARSQLEGLFSGEGARA
jgi:hypothetical protein